MKKKPIGVSVIIPTYNSAGTIQYTLQSVLNQTYKNWEIIVVDDCSVDQTCSFVENIGQSFPNIHLIRMKRNVGVAMARNVGVKYSKYEILAFLDSDDIWENDKLFLQIKMINKYPNASLFYTGSSFIDGLGNKKKYILNVPQSVSYEKLLEKNIISCSSVLVKKSLYLKYPMPNDKKLHEDFVTWLQILKEGGYAYGVQEPLLIYRLTPKSKSRNKLSALRMNWNVYVYLKIPFLKRVFLMGKYIKANVIKYLRIYMLN